MRGFLSWQRAGYRVLFYVGILIAALAFFAIYYEQQNGDDDGGKRRKSPVPDGPLTVPRDWLDKVRA